MSEAETLYSLYLLRCNDGSLYTGIATDVGRRLAEHDGNLRGARYLRGRQPLELVFQAVVGSRGRASQLEYRIKRLPRGRKLALIAGEFSWQSLLDPV